MRDYRKQAIEDVARACHVEVEDVEFYLRPDASSRFIAAYAVAQRERVLRMKDALRWADGRRGEFVPRQPGQGPYWWRTELMTRSGFYQDEKSAPQP